MLIRELPPLQLYIDAVSPSGRHYRWGADEPHPANVPSGLRFSSTMPGGFESMDVTLARKPDVEYSDLKRLSTLRVLGAGSDVAGEYRLERAPLVSGDRMAISPSAVGWQANLDDDKSASMIYIDRDLGRWRSPSGERMRYLRNSELRGDVSFNVQPNAEGTVPQLVTAITGAWTANGLGYSEAWYDSGAGNLIGQLRSDWARLSNLNSGDANWSWDAILAITDGFAISGSDQSGNLRAAGPASVTVTATGNRRYAFVRLAYAAAAGEDSVIYSLAWYSTRVIGNHGLTIRGTTAATEGFLASDVVAHAVRQWAPMLRITDESIQPSALVIPQLAFPDPGPVSQIVKGATRFELLDWAVWDARVFWLHERGAHGRNWRARIGPAQLEETGPQLDRLWESITVEYQDVDGSTRTVGPPGSGADTENTLLKDSDPDNPANQLGIIRRDRLVMGIGTAGSATEIGRRFLEQTKLLDNSGRARLVGHVQDDRGILHPYWRVRAGDTVSFIDAADPSPRRIVRADHDDPTRTCSVDLDAPPDGLAALLERLGVGLVRLGL